MKLLAILLVAGVSFAVFGSNAYQELLDFHGDLRIIDEVGDAPNRILAMTLGNKNPELNISISKAVESPEKLLSEGKVELVLTANPLFLAESKHPYAIEAAIVVVSLSNPLTNISLENLGKIYRGEISDWYELLQSDYAIHRYLVKPDLYGYSALKKTLSGALTDKIYLDSQDNLIKLIQGNRNALGVIGLLDEAQMDQVKVLTVDGVAPTKENIRTGKYPIIAVRYAAVGKSPSTAVQKYLSVVKGIDFARIINRNGLLSIRGVDGEQSR